MEKYNVLGIQFTTGLGPVYASLDVLKKITPKFSLTYHFVLEKTIFSGFESFEGEIQFPSNPEDYNPSKGDIEQSAYIDLNPLYESDEFRKFIEKYGFLLEKDFKYQILLNIKTGSTDKIRSTFTNITVNPYFEKSIIYSKPEILKDEVSITVSDTKLDPIKIENIQSAYNSIKAEYDRVKEQYDWVISQENLDFSIGGKKVAYSSISTFDSLITRLLEFDAVTLKEAITIAKDTKLGEEERLLLRISGLINTLTSMYSRISLSDGEGIPYNRGVWIDPSSKVEFSSEDGEDNYDTFEDQFLILARDESGYLYNPALENSYRVRNSTGQDFIRNFPECSLIYPTGFFWNNEGWTDVSDFIDRSFDFSLDDLVDQEIESDVTSQYLILKTYNGEYWRIKFDDWNSYDTGKIDVEGNPIYNSYPGSSHKRTRMYKGEF